LIIEFSGKEKVAQLFKRTQGKELFNVNVTTLAPSMKKRGRQEIEKEHTQHTNRGAYYVCRAARTGG
jgi:hypothetical protein